MQLVTTDTWLGFIQRQVMSTTYTVRPNDCESWPWQIDLLASQSQAANHHKIVVPAFLNQIVGWNICSNCWRFLVYLKSQQNASLNHSRDLIMDSLDLPLIGSRWCDHDVSLHGDFQNGGWKGWGGGGTAVADATTKPTRLWSISDLADVGCDVRL